MDQVVSTQNLYVEALIISVNVLKTGPFKEAIESKWGPKGGALI